MNFVGSSFFLFFLLVVKITPIKVIPVYIFLFSRFCYYSQIRKKVIKTNLNIAFGEDQSNERMKLIKKIYINAATVWFELLKLDSMQAEQLKQIYPKETYYKIKDIKQTNEGMVILGGHIANWELDTFAISVLGNPTLMFVGKHKNTAFANRLNKIRSRFTDIILAGEKSSIQMSKALDQGKTLIFASDQNVPNRKLFVDFFHTPASFGRGAITYALKKNVPLVLVWGIRKGLFQYEGCIQKIDYELTGNIKQDIQRTAQLVSNLFQTIIEQNPDQYFWFNKRWKTRPNESDPSLYA